MINYPQFQFNSVSLRWWGLAFLKIFHLTYILVQDKLYESWNRKLTRFIAKNSQLPNIEIDVVFGFVSNKRAEASSDDHMPSSWVSGGNCVFNGRGDIFSCFESINSVVGGINNGFLHLFRHVGQLHNVGLIHSKWVQIHRSKIVARLSFFFQFYFNFSELTINHNNYQRNSNHLQNPTIYGGRRRFEPHMFVATLIIVFMKRNLFVLY